MKSENAGTGTEYVILGDNSSAVHELANANQRSAVANTLSRGAVSQSHMCTSGGYAALVIGVSSLLVAGRSARWLCFIQRGEKRCTETCICSRTCE